MLKYIKEHPFLWGFSFASITLVEFLVMYGTVFQQRLVDHIVEGDMNKISASAFIYISYSIVSSTSLIFSDVIHSKAKVELGNSVRRNILHASLSKKYQEFKKESTTEYTSCLTNDVNILNSSFSDMLYMTVHSLFGVLVSLGILAYYNVILAIIAFLSSGIITVLPVLLGKLQGRLQKRKSDELASFLSLATNVFEGFSVIASFGVNPLYKSRMDKKLKELKNAEYTSEKWRSITDGTAQVLSVTVQAGLFVFAGSLMIKGKLSIGSFFIFSSLNTNICSSMTMLLRTVPVLMSVKPIVSKIDAFCTVADKKEGRPPVVFRREINVEALSFGYEDGKEVLHNQTMVFEKGKKYAVIGKSGAGKSTLIQLLRGEFTNYSGSIRYDGRELRDCDEDSVRELIALVEQDTYIFEDTIKNNISLYENFTEEQLMESVRRAGLEDFIEEIPERLEHMLKEKGKNLSGGQKQRIALARAFVRDRHFIILDEGTSALDQKTAEDIENRLLQTEGLTLITVTHHLTDRDKYDAVYEICPIQ